MAFAFDNIGTSTQAGLNAKLDSYRVSISANNAERSELRAKSDAVERAIQTETIAEHMRDNALRTRSRILESYKQRYAAAVAAR
jgi:hypothetical protein